jgi:hypothetical protein
MKRYADPGAVGPGSRCGRRRYAEPPAATHLTGLGMREFPLHPRHRGTLRYAHLHLRCGSRIRTAHGYILKSNALYEALYAPVQHVWPFRWVKTPLNPFPHPHRRACQHASYVNGAAVLRGAAALRVTAAVRAGRLGGIGTGNIKKTALRAGSTSPPAGSNREQALHSRTLKILPIPLTPPPAQLNHAALFPGLDSHAVIKGKGS